MARVRVNRARLALTDIRYLRQQCNSARQRNDAMCHFRTHALCTCFRKVSRLALYATDRFSAAFEKLVVAFEARNLGA